MLQKRSLQQEAPCFENKGRRSYMPAFFSTFFLLPFFCFSQTEDINFPKKYWGRPDTVSAVLEDTLNNFCYLSTRGEGHNAWQLNRLSLSNYQYTDVSNSDNDPLVPAYKEIIFSGDTIFMLGDNGILTAFNISTRKLLWKIQFARDVDVFLGDMILYKNRLIVGGEFIDASGESLTSINTKDGKSSDLDFKGTSIGFSIIWRSINKLLLHGDILYIGGTFLKNSTNVSSYLGAWDLKRMVPIYWGPGLNGEVDDLLITGDLLYVCGNFTRVDGSPRNRLAAFDISLDTISFPSLSPFFLNVNNRVREIEHYNGTLFLSGDFSSVNSMPRNYVASFDINSGKLSSWSPVFPSWVHLNRIRNRLYVIRQDMDFFKVYCLRPAKPSSFSMFGRKACINDTGLKFSIPTLPYATSYYWSYSGSGVTINGNGTSSVSLDFSNAATSGYISVRGNVYCGEYGDTISMPVTVNPLPVIYAGLDDTLTCSDPTLDLKGVSNTDFARYSWTGPQQCNGNCPVFGVHKNGNYILTVLDTISGCVQRDSVRIGIDTVPPGVILPSGPFILSCKVDTLVLKGSSPTLNSNIYWHKISDSQYFSNPFNASSIGQYFMVVQNKGNGCKDSSSIILQQDVNVPNVKLKSHAYFVNKPIDTLNCRKSRIILNGSTDSLNAILSWSDIYGRIFENPNIVSQPGIYFFEAMDTLNGCKSKLSVSIARDISVPHLSMPSGQFNLTCSDSLQLLDAFSGTPGVVLNWNGPGSFSSPDPAIATLKGTYKVTATRPDNGCSKSDSVAVGYSPELKVIPGKDTTVCKGSLINLSAKAISNNSDLTYLWNTGIDGSVIAVSPSATSIYTVTVSGNACIGTASMRVAVPQDISDSVYTVQSCDGSGMGTIQVWANGGIPPYLYSLDNGIVFQQSNVFNKVPFGQYALVIKDSLACIKSDRVVLNGNSNPPKPEFIVSTLNKSGDTLVFVDISNPRPDSISWIFPAGLQQINTDPFNPMVWLNDTGKFSITMTARYGNCFIPVSKHIFISKKDSSSENYLQGNGIISVTLYPNPNAGQFTVEVELYKKQNFVLQVVDASGNVQWSLQQRDAKTFKRNINITHLQNGTYVFRVIAEHDTGYRNFVISR